MAIRWSSESTHHGEYLGVAPTGKHIHLEGLDLLHLQDDKIAEVWIAYDNRSALQQMGALAEPGQATWDGGLTRLPSASDRL